MLMRTDICVDYVYEVALRGSRSPVEYPFKAVISFSGVS